MEDGVSTEGMASNNEVLEEIRIMNAQSLAKIDFACLTDLKLNSHPLDFKYEADSMILRIFGLNGDVLIFDDISTISFGDSSKDENICNVVYKVSSATVEKRSFSDKPFSNIEKVVTLKAENQL